NASTGLDTIDFNITGPSLHLINLTSPLPAITEAVTVDGYTQSGASPNTLPVGDNAVLRVGLDGSLLSNGSGLTILGSNSTVRGLKFQHFEGDNYFNAVSIRIQGAAATGNHVEGNFIGTDGVQDLTAGSPTGVMINGASGNTVGGDTPAARNVIASN